MTRVRWQVFQFSQIVLSDYSSEHQQRRTATVFENSKQHTSGPTGALFDRTRLAAKNTCHSCRCARTHVGQSPAHWSFIHIFSSWSENQNSIGYLSSAILRQRNASFSFPILCCIAGHSARSVCECAYWKFRQAGDDIDSLFIFLRLPIVSCTFLCYLVVLPSPHCASRHYIIRLGERIHFGRALRWHSYETPFEFEGFFVCVWCSWYIAKARPQAFKFYGYMRRSRAHTLRMDWW